MQGIVGEMWRKREGREKGEVGKDGAREHLYNSTEYVHSTPPI
jgi:hypothetical protein